MKIKACVNCGFCCLKAPCGFGMVSENGTGCVYLVFDQDGLSSCGIYTEILKDPTSSISPAFGSGCCMGLFNERRQAVIDNVYDGIEQYIDILNFKGN